MLHVKYRILMHLIALEMCVIVRSKIIEACIAYKHVTVYAARIC